MNVPTVKISCPEFGFEVVNADAGYVNIYAINEKGERLKQIEKDSNSVHCLDAKMLSVIVLLVKEVDEKLERIIDEWSK